MTTTYPYYTVCRFDSGILRKVYNERKFEDIEHAINALDLIVKKVKERGGTCDDQYVIVEYPKPFTSRMKIILEKNIVTWL